MRGVNPHVLADVLGVVADALERARDPQHVERPADRARIFHHERDALPLQRFVFLVDHAVLAGNLECRVRVHARKRIERAVHHVRDEFADVLDFAVTVGRPVERGQPRGDVAELLGLVAYALEVGDGLDDGDDQTQVRGRRSARRQDAAAVVVDGDFHRVDLVVEPRHLLAEPAVARVERLDAVLQLLLDEAAHLQDPGADALEVGIEAAQDVVREI